LIYGAIGSFDVVDISDFISFCRVTNLVSIGIVLLTIGMLFKVAAVPSFWAPDVYEGSPALTTALMSTLAKVVSMATLFKLLTVVNADLSPSFQMVIVIVSMANDPGISWPCVRC
jgi:NADH-quinone oxidoreductase subunit N